MDKPRIEPSEVEEAENFEPWDPKFRCCCGSVHVKQGALIVGSLTGVLILYSLFIVFINLGLQTFWSWIQIFWLLIDLCAVLLLLYGVYSENHKFLLPYLIYSFHTILLLIFGISLAIYSWFYWENAQQWFPMELLFERHHWDAPVYDEEKVVKMAATFIGISCFFTLLITTWWSWVVLKCYRFFRTSNRLRFYLNSWERLKYLPLNLDK